MYGIYANMTGVYWWDPWHTIYSSTIRILWDGIYWIYPFLPSQYRRDFHIGTPQKVQQMVILGNIELLCWLPIG